MRRRWRWWLAGVYLVLVVASHLYQWSRPADGRLGAGELSVEIPMPRASGLDPSATIRLAYYEVGDASDGRPPIIVMHGSPGNSGGFVARFGGEPSFAERLSRGGRRVLAVDLPGFGGSSRWVDDYSAHAAGWAVAALLDELGIERAHLVCWSNSGAAGLWMCEDAPERVASLTLMAAVGAQETEGSGSYWFEHAKYALGVPFVEVLPELLPHFGVLGPRSMRHSFIRSFLDTDQRPLADVMRRTRVPTLIVHGRDDFLISAWAAEAHHGLMPTSRLVMMDGMHFLPFIRAGATAEEIVALAERHDEMGVAALTGYENRVPRAEYGGPSGAVQGLSERVRWWPWWVVGLLLMGGAMRWPESATMVAGVFVATGDLDFGVALAGLWLGRLMHGREMPGGGWWWMVRAVAWGVVALSMASVFGGRVMGFGETAGGWLIVPGLFVCAGGLRLVRHVWTQLGRARIRAAITRTTHHEWWPTWALYLPTVLSLPVFAVRGRGVTAFTACNPGIDNGGGFIGESKSAIMAKLRADDPRVLRTGAMGAGGAERAAAVLGLIERDAALGGFPVIIKPDAGQRGEGVRLAKGPEDIRKFLASHRGAAVVQRFHPGPHEAGVFWVRKDARDDPRPIGERDGFISSITLKRFQFLEGDGVRTIRRLIMDHPRYRCQMRLFFGRFAERLGEVLPAGERLALSFMGNHAQGTRFAEGGHLATPELEAAINGLARSFAGGGLDYGRFDVRYADEGALARGEGFAVLEVNGTTSEPTNIYDPAHGPRFAWRTLRRHWGHMYRIGRERVGGGAKSLSVWRFVVLVVRGG